jgi:hypothetical protein
MPRVAPAVETDLLCEGCGYILNGLPPGGNCPECGKPISESIGDHRSFSAFEESPSFFNFIRTTLAIIFTTRKFYLNLITRKVTLAAVHFYDFHILLASALFAFAAFGHFIWLIRMLGFGQSLSTMMFAMIAVFMAMLVFGLMSGLTKLAAWLSSLEGHYWGMRLPYPVVLRGMRFHAANYLPVGLLAVGIVWGYRVMLQTGIVDGRYDDVYLYTLCGVVILSAGYLFRSYWVAMRNMMYANR